MEYRSISNNSDSKLIIPSVILGIALIISAGIGSYSVIKLRQMGNTISVTGSAKTKVIADTAKWTFEIRREATQTTLKNGYELISKDILEVRNFLNEYSIPTEEFEISPVFTEQQYIQNQGPDTPNKYFLRQTISISSSNINKISTLADSINSLAGKGVFISSGYPQYFYSKLPEVRISLLSDAIKDAKKRAQEISKANGENVGELVSASSGVVQVMAPNSIDVDDYGTYDTSSKEKEITITVRGVFNIR